MIAIDTNILVRALTDDEESPQQTQLARKLIKAAGRVFVPQIVQIELVWVLQSAYYLEKEEIISALQNLLDSPTYQLQHEKHFMIALSRFRNSNAGFADSIIATESQQMGAALWTFDRKLSTQDGVIRLTQDTFILV